MVALGSGLAVARWILRPDWLGALAQAEPTTQGRAKHGKSRHGPQVRLEGEGLGFRVKVGKIMAQNP